MKRTALSIGLLILVAIGSGWFGYQIRNPSLRTYSYSVVVNCGGGDGGNYPKEAFRIVNEELPGKIDRLLGDFASHNHIVAVTPEISGYCVRIAGPSGTKLWAKETERELSEWIHRRMDEIQREEQRMAEQGAPSDGDKPSK